jgi:hypothetical protein
MPINKKLLMISKIKIKKSRNKCKLIYLILKNKIDNFFIKIMFYLNKR